MRRIGLSIAFPFEPSGPAVPEVSHRPGRGATARLAVLSFRVLNLICIVDRETGRTLICEGRGGCLFEVTPDGEVVWEYISPYRAHSMLFDAELNWIFRAYRYAPGAPQLKGRV